jgi:hypothetical protein
MAETLSNETFGAGQQLAYTCQYSNTDGAANYFYPGFLPTKVEVINITTAAYHVWMSPMPDASHLDILAAAAYAATNGITVGQAATTASVTGPFILVGTDIINANETIYLRASR